MRSSLVRLEVLPSPNREIYERSLIGQLHGSSTGPNSSPHVPKGKGPPPPVKAKPTFKPHENPPPNPEVVSVSHTLVITLRWFQNIYVKCSDAYM